MGTCTTWWYLVGHAVAPLCGMQCMGHRLRAVERGISIIFLVCAVNGDEVLASDVSNSRVQVLGLGALCAACSGVRKGWSRPVCYAF